MFGKLIRRNCPKCDKETRLEVSVGYSVDGKHYYPNLYCYTCETDLSKEDREVLELAKRSFFSSSSLDFGG